jgi:hypothetical protein
MRTRTSIIVAAFLSQLLSAQTSIGFRDPLNLRPIRDYRLPAWSYRTLSLDFSFDGSSYNHRYGENPSQFNKNLVTSLNPSFHQYFESESRIRDFTISLRTEYNRADQNNAPSEYSSQRLFEMMLYSFLDLKHYLYRDFFLMNDIQLDVRYLNNDYKGPESYETQSETSGYSNASQKLFDGQIKLGLGIGRVRNVTPVIRALRLVERLRALGRGDSLSAGAVDSIAQTVSKYAGYSNAYDRPTKYFWRDLYSHFQWAESLKPFEFYYLAETMAENTGTRLEGSDISAGLLLGADSKRYKYGLLNGSRWHAHPHDLFVPGFFTQARWYRNLTLNRQIGIELMDEFLKNPHPERDYDRTNIQMIDEWGAFETSYRWGNLVRLSPQFLWMVNDRVLWSTDVTASLKHYKRYDTRYNERSLDLRTSVVVFMENSFSLTTTASAFFDKSTGYQSTSTRDLALSICLKYYFLRGMQ